jgi:hypothetical protein
MDVAEARWRIAPTVLKMAPCAMSVPIATVGLKPSRSTRMAVMSEPPPMPVTHERTD